MLNQNDICEANVNALIHRAIIEKQEIIDRIDQALMIDVDTAHLTWQLNIVKQELEQLHEFKKSHAMA